MSLADAGSFICNGDGKRSFSEKHPLIMSLQVKRGAVYLRKLM